MDDIGLIAGGLVNIAGLLDEEILLDDNELVHAVIVRVQQPEQARLALS